MKLTDAIKKFFRRRHADETAGQQPSATPQPLRIEGVKPAPLTPEPDDAELAAQALLETICDPTPAPSPTREGSGYREGSETGVGPDTPRDAAYYHALADRMRMAREAIRLKMMRFLSWCEEQLLRPHLPTTGPGSLGFLEAGIYKRINIAEQLGGDLKRRWQHCLAEVTVRRMKEERENEERRMKNEKLSESPTDPNEDTTEATARP